MRTRQIPREEWVKFFDNFSRRQEGWGVSLEVFGPEIGDQTEEKNLFFAGLSAELHDEGDKIAIMMGGNASSHLTHTISAPTHVDVQQNDLGIDSALRIRAADGTTTLLHLSNT